MLASGSIGSPSENRDNESLAFSSAYGGNPNPTGPDTNTFTVQQLNH